MKDVVVVDLDGTLYDSTNREPLAETKQWEEFHRRSIEDPPNMAVLQTLYALDALGPEITIIACTGRNDAHRKITDDWLMKHEVPVQEVLMRPEGNFASDAEIKVALLEEWIGENRPGLALVEAVLLVLEDRDKMVEAWRDLGLDCWQVKHGGY